MRVSNLTKRFSAFLLTLAVSVSIVATNVKAEGFSAQELTKTTSFTVGNKAKDVNIESSIKVNKANLNKDERGIYIDWEIVSNVNSEGGGVYAPLVSPKGWNNHNWHSILLPNSLKDPENLKINGESQKDLQLLFHTILIGKMLINSENKVKKILIMILKDSSQKVQVLNQEN